jgi:outer membrane protein OmpA-like peptidoglycan-associated protein
MFFAKHYFTFFASILFSFHCSFLLGQEILDSNLVIEEVMIYFESDEYELDKDAQSEVSILCKTMEKAEGIQYYVDAHTDAVGSEAYNLRLSDQRRQAVREVLLCNGVADSLIFSAFFGEKLKLKEGATEADNQLNRRARIRVVKQQPLIYLKGKIFDPENKQGLNAEISLSSRYYKGFTKSDSLGRFQILSPLNETIDLEVLARNYFIETNTLLITERHKTLELKIPLPRLEMGKRYLFKNMLFLGNRSVMIDASERSAHHLKRFMDLHPDVCIEIAGHMNLPFEEDVPRASGFFELSVARALEIKNRMLAEGVGEERMLVRGYGNWEMMYPKAKSPTEMGLNRRVEIGILDCKKAHDEADDFVPDHLRYQKVANDRYYSKRNINYDIRHRSNNLTIHMQVASMIKAGIDPEKYTYGEILSAYPAYPEDK